MARKMIETDIIECKNFTFFSYHGGRPRDGFYDEIAVAVKEGWELFGPIQFITDKDGVVIAIQQIVKYEEIKES